MKRHEAATSRCSVAAPQKKGEERREKALSLEVAGAKRAPQAELTTNCSNYMNEQVAAGFNLPYETRDMPGARLANSIFPPHYVVQKRSTPKIRRIADSPGPTHGSR